MSDYDNRNSLVLFKNKEKREGKRDPEYRGTYTDADGFEHFVDVWINESKTTGEKYMRGKTKRKDKQPASAGAQNDFDKKYPSEGRLAVPPAPAAGDLDDSIPF